MFCRRSASVAAAVFLSVRLIAGPSWIEKPIEFSSVEDPSFLASIQSFCGIELRPGNRITELLNGEKFFPEMLRAISGAERTICLKTSSGGPGKSATNSSTP